MHEGIDHRELEPESLRDLRDETPPVPGERRRDSDGQIWIWSPTHHSVAEELDIASSNGDYWEKRLAIRSSDSEKSMRGEQFVVEKQVENSAFAQPAYDWRPEKK